jgi:hypothetical protein
MGHTLATITNHFDRFMGHLSSFKRALRKADQLALEAMLSEVRQHLPAAGYASNVVPGVTFLLCLLLEKHKQIERHEAEFVELRREFKSEIGKLRDEFRVEKLKLQTEYFLRGMHYGFRRDD